MDAGEFPTESDTPVVSDPLLGTLLDGKYLIESRLGAGGMGVVYTAVQQSLGRHVALKVLAPRLNTDPLMEQRFRVEARAASQLRSRHAVTVHDFGVTEDGLLYIAMELLDGESLRARLRRSPLTVPDSILIGSQIAEALVEAHAREPRIIHRDIKPDNVMLQQAPGGEPVATVLDFGLALLTSDPRLTASDIVVGTVAYMAPEQATGHTIDDRLDVYALGVTLFEMIAGRTPFLAANHVGMLHQHVYEKPPALSDLAADVPASLEELIFDMLAKKPEERLTALQVMTRLRAIQGALRFDSDPSAVPTFLEVSPVRRQMRSRSRMVVVGGASLLVASVAGAILWHSHRAAPPVVPISVTVSHKPLVAPLPPDPAPTTVTTTAPPTHATPPKKKVTRPPVEKRYKSSDDEFLRPFEGGK